jgi:protein-S-isoprenylcysteine O-methyltransferase Ste14
MRPTLAALYLVWTVWGVTWSIAALWANRAVARPAPKREWGYRIFTFPGWVLLLAWPIDSRRPFPPGPWQPLWHLPTGIEWALVALAAAGCAFAWWARIYLGRLWSAGLTRKADHRLVDSGPYAIVRHPIYTGLYMAALATLGIRASAIVSAGFVLYLIGYWRKAHEEEHFLGQELGLGTYESYRRRVPMLLPFVRK